MKPSHLILVVLFSVVGDLLSSGTITRILKKYAAEYPGAFYVTAKPYAPLGE